LIVCIPTDSRINEDCESKHEARAAHATRAPYGEMVHPRLPIVTSELPEEFALTLCKPGVYAFEFVNTNLLFSVQLEVAIAVYDSVKNI
jgi:hypothetical protein